jgi:hypothetical protein
MAKSPIAKWIHREFYHKAERKGRERQRGGTIGEGEGKGKECIRFAHPPLWVFHIHTRKIVPKYYGDGEGLGYT